MDKKSLKRFLKTATIEFLDIILGLAESTTTIAASRKEVYKIAMSGNFDREWTVENICRFIQSLKQRNYIEVKTNKDGQESLRYTNKAKLKMLDRIADKCGKSELLYLVSFDIPEQLKIKRNQFRRAIKRMGFRQIQKSLWITDRNIGEFVELAAKEYEVEDYIVYIQALRTNIDKIIRTSLKK